MAHWQLLASLTASSILMVCVVCPPVTDKPTSSTTPPPENDDEDVVSDTVLCVNSSLLSLSVKRRLCYRQRHCVYINVIVCRRIASEKRHVKKLLIAQITDFFSS